MKNEKIKQPKITDPIGENYIDELKEKYPPKQSASGEDYSSSLVYVSVQNSFFSDQKILNLIMEEGLNPIGYLFLLRTLYMSTGLGYGISLKDKSLQKAMLNISLDTEIPLETLKEYHQTLIDYGILFTISNKAGNKVLTERNQLYDFELKEYTRIKNKRYKESQAMKAKEDSISTTDPEEELESVKVQPEADRTDFQVLSDENAGVLHLGESDKSKEVDYFNRPCASPYDDLGPVDDDFGFGAAVDVDSII